jgi:Fur family zinc uptake transcriptional regulator
MQKLNVSTIAKKYKFTLTSLRTDILTVLLKVKKPVKAYEVLALIQAETQRTNIKPIIVYRVLNFFMQKKLVHKLRSNSSFFLCKEERCLNHAHLTAFLICEKCDQVEEINDNDLMHNFSNILNKHNFKIIADHLELNGFCAQCQ